MLRLCARLVLATTMFAFGATARADEYALGQTDESPEGLSEGVAAAIAPQGLLLTGPKREYASLWLAESLPVAADFEATAAIRYPFQPGQLIGVLQVPRRADFLDFRGNELERGTYTLRYGRMPLDGNHIGVSDLVDFLVAIPADQDEDPAVLEDPQTMVELSAEASGTTHPAILSLEPAEDAADATLTHDEDREFWILQLQADAQQDGESTKLPIRLVVAGISEG